MKLILSRKGFDSSNGKGPSPIFRDGRMLSLPIPDRGSPITYGQISGCEQASAGVLVEDLVDRPSRHGAHLDPDLGAEALPRMPGWRPLFGQTGAAEKHLENCGVTAGDVFLFFGLFGRVEQRNGNWSYVRGSRPKHVIFGWLQVEDRVPVSRWPKQAAWALYHPHFFGDRNGNNVLYVATDRLSLPGFGTLPLPGAGLFRYFDSALQLTAEGSDKPSHWILPEWFHPEGRRSALSYHQLPSRWRLCGAGAALTSVSRGQEFVLDCDAYPEAVGWVDMLVRSSSRPR